MPAIDELAEAKKKFDNTLLRTKNEDGSYSPIVLLKMNPVDPGNPDNIYPMCRKLVKGLYSYTWGGNELDVDSQILYEYPIDRGYRILSDRLWYLTRSTDRQWKVGANAINTKFHPVMRWNINRYSFSLDAVSAKDALTMVNPCPSKGSIRKDYEKGTRVITGDVAVWSSDEMDYLLYKTLAIAKILNDKGNIKMLAPELMVFGEVLFETCDVGDILV